MALPIPRLPPTISAMPGFGSDKIRALSDPVPSTRGLVYRSDAGHQEHAAAKRCGVD